MLMPSLILILGGLLLPLLPNALRQAAMLTLPIAALWFVHHVTGAGDSFVLMGYSVLPKTIHPFTPIFATIFSIAAFGGALFALKNHSRVEIAAAFVYAGAAIGVTFSGDWLLLFTYWEIMAVASTVVVLASTHDKRIAVAMRYAVTHFFGGILLLLGLLLNIQITGTSEVATLQLTTDEILTVLGGDVSNLRAFANVLILLGVLVNLAAPPFSAWLADSYPTASPFGSVFLSAFTTKTAVFVLLTEFAGTAILIPIGIFMIFYGIIWAMLENNIRRILSYSIVNQVGFMVVGVGIGTPLAQAGVAAHAFCHIIYKALLFMSAGSVTFMTGKHKCSEVGGLYRTMPVTMWCGIIGALAISAFPLTSGFVSKSLISSAAGYEHMLWVWLALMAASAGVFLHAGIKFPWFVFFHRDSGLRPKDPPESMRMAMLLFAGLCIVPALYPPLLYDLLPYDPGYQPYSVSHVIAQLELLLFSGLAFFLFVRYSRLLERTDTISLDLDYLYRKSLKNLCVVAYEFIFGLWDVLLAAGKGFVLRVHGEIYRHHGPLGFLARNWAIGNTVLYTTAILSFVLILYYLAG